MSKFRFPFGDLGKYIDLLFLTINFQKRAQKIKFVSIIFFHFLTFFEKGQKQAKKVQILGCIFSNQSATDRNKNLHRFLPKPRTPCMQQVFATRVQLCYDCQPMQQTWQ
jgi:hypothetical protein